MEILSILMVAVTVEALTEGVKSLKKDGKVDTAMIVSLFIAELLTITAAPTKAEFDDLVAAYNSLATKVNTLLKAVEGVGIVKLT